MNRFNFYLGLSGLFLSGLAFASSANISDYAYVSKIPDYSHLKKVVVDLSPELLREVNSRFSNLALFNQNNEEVAFDVYFEPAHKHKNLKALEVSSYHGGGAKNLVDNSVLTSFLFDEKVDRKNASWVIVDLGRLYSLARIKILPRDRHRIRYVSVEGGRSLDDFKTVYSKRSFDRFLDFNSDLVRYVKVSFWGTRIDLDDIQFYVNDRAAFSFQPQKGFRYSLFYGGRESDLLRFDRRVSDLNTIEAVPHLKSQFNPKFPDDIDDDGVLNSVDNCPLDDNSSQEDSDGDGHGDICDNAIRAKNYDQSDVDRDGVGDVIDNCKLEPNFDQADRDSDGFGDACDSAHAKPTLDRSEDVYRRYFPGLALVALGLFLFFIRPKPAKKS